MGTAHQKYEPITGVEDYAATLLTTNVNNWMGLADSSDEWGTRVAFQVRLDNGIQGNPGAAKLDVSKLSFEEHLYFNPSDGEPRSTGTRTSPRSAGT